MNDRQRRFIKAANALGLSRQRGIGERGITQAEIASNLGVSLRSVARWLSKVDVVVPLTAVLALESLIKKKS